MSAPQEAKIKKTDNIKFWWEESSHIDIERVIGTTPFKKLWLYLLKLNIYLSYDPAFYSWAFTQENWRPMKTTQRCLYSLSLFLISQSSFNYCPLPSSKQSYPRYLWRLLLNLMDNFQLFYDLSGAFHTLDFSLLLDNLSSLIQRHCLSWFYSYLSGCCCWVSSTGSFISVCS